MYKIAFLACDDVTQQLFPPVKGFWSITMYIKGW
jgi:hypothetical protein